MGLPSGRRRCSSVDVKRSTARASRSTSSSAPSPGASQLATPRRSASTSWSSGPGCCARHLGAVCDTFVDYRAGGAIDAAVTLKHLAHGEVLGSFVHYAQAWSELAEFAETLAVVGPNDAWVLFLLGWVAETDSDLLTAEFRYRAAWRDDPDVAVVREALAGIEIDRGRFASAMSLLGHDDIDPPTRLG